MCLGEVGEGAVDGAQVGGPHEQKGHAGSEEADASLGVSGEGLALEVFLPKGNDIVTEPIVFERLDVADGQAGIVVAEVGLVGCGELETGGTGSAQCQERDMVSTYRIAKPSDALSERHAAPKPALLAPELARAIENGQFGRRGGRRGTTGMERLLQTKKGRWRTSLRGGQRDEAEALR